MAARGRRILLSVMVAMTVAILVVFAAFVVGGCSSDGTVPGSTAGTVAPPDASADAAPDFQGVTLDGADVSLSEYRGKPLVLAFMASW